MLEQGLDRTVLRKMALPVETEPPLTEWREFLTKLKNPKHSIKSCSGWEIRWNFLMLTNRLPNRLSIAVQ